MNKKPEFDFANPIVSAERLRNLPPGAYVVAGEAADELNRQALAGVIVTISPEGRAALEADKTNTRRNFVSNFVAERIKAGTWPDTDVMRLVMLGELIDAWERRNEKD